MHRPKGPKNPEIFWNAQAQDSQESQDFFGTIRQDADKVPKNLGILGNLGPAHESCTLFIGILGNLGPVHESCTLFIGILGNLGPVQVL